jgi:septal ring factor EnvC (AmiA/AmiB activator)
MASDLLCSDDELYPYPGEDVSAYGDRVAAQKELAEIKRDRVRAQQDLTETKTAMAAMRREITTLLERNASLASDLSRKQGENSVLVQWNTILREHCRLTIDETKEISRLHDGMNRTPIFIASATATRNVSHRCDSSQSHAHSESRHAAPRPPVTPVKGVTKRIARTKR